MAEAIIAGAVIRNEQGGYLMVQERKALAYGLWGFPGGHVDEGETLAAAAVRETGEEVGLKVEIIGKEPIVTGHIEKIDHDYNAFLAKVIGGSFRVDYDELIDARYMTAEEIEALDAQDKTRDPIIYRAILKAEEL